VELLNAYGASPCKLLPTSEGNQEAADLNGQADLDATRHIDLHDVTHVITMTMQFRDHEAVEGRKNQVIRAAEASGKQISTAPNTATGRRGDLIAVVTVSLAHTFNGMFPWIVGSCV